MRRLPNIRPEPLLRARGGRRLGHALLLAAVALSVSGCVSAADDPQGFVIELFGFIAVFWVVGFVAIRLLIRQVFKSYGIGDALRQATIENGMPGEAIIETIADTGMTMSSPDVGAAAPRYQFGLQITPADGGAPYEVEVKAFVPRLYIPMVVPGKRVGVMIDPTNPMNVSIDFNRIDGAS